MLLRNLNSTLRKYIYPMKRLRCFLQWSATMFKRAGYYDKPTILIILIKIYCFILLRSIVRRVTIITTAQLRSVNIQWVKTMYLQL